MVYLKPEKLLMTTFFISLWSEMCFLKKTPSIAVIGGGIGGTSASYFLYELFGQKGAHIDLYEPKKIGGRLAVREVNGRNYEVGGSIIHARNKYMVDFLKMLELKKRDSATDSKLGLYDGKEFVFSESNWQLLTLAKLAWRYGFGPLQLQNYVEDRLNNFERIYGLQENGETFVSVSDLLRAMNPEFSDNLLVTTRKSFIENGFSEKLVDELVAATLTANYGQSTSVHEFVGSVSVAGADGKLWAVHGGNKIVPEMLMERSKATYIPAKVTNIILRSKTNDFELQYVNTNDNNPSSTNSSVYDIVIIATPLSEDKLSGIEFTNFPKKFQFPGRYHRTVCTIVEGKLDPSYFGFKTDEDIIDEILTVKLGLEFNSVGRINPVDYKEGEGRFDVWKIFTQTLVTKTLLNKLFANHSSVVVEDWLAYPHYHTDQRNDRFVLHKNLFHINAIEWAASAMEMSVIGAKNAALLSYKSWNNIEDTKHHKVKEEL